MKLMRTINPTKYSRVSINTINEMAANDQEKLVAQSELYYNTQLVMVADRIIKDKKNIVLLSGPSASGKTTTAHKLIAELRGRGLTSHVISMDDFFLGMENYQLLDNGSPDMESVDTLDMELLNTCFKELLERGSADFPIFDFEKQRRSDKTRRMELKGDDVFIMEGIHALNPLVLKDIHPERVFKMYISVRTKFMNGDSTDSIIEPSELRLIRRMVRDALFRNYPAMHTVEYWDHVLESEKIYIDPYRDNVDFKMDSTLDYEVCVWHTLLNKRLEEVELSGVSQHETMQRVLKALKRMEQLSVDVIPKDSLLREFIGKKQ